MKKAALVTGAGGFIGSHLVGELLAAGWRVVGLDNFDPFYDRSIKEKRLSDLTARPGFEFHETDIRDSTGVQRLLAGVDVVLHLAARPGVRASISDPLEYVSVNVQGTVSVLEAARAAGVRQFVYASSSSVYGPDASLPFKEQSPVGPLSPYSASKLAGEQFCSVYSRLHDFRVAILRLFTVYGPGQRPDLAIHRFTSRLSSGLPVVMFGDGSSERDYTHVTDISTGIIRAIQWVSNGAPTCEVFNLGNGRATALRGVIDLVATALGSEPLIEEAPLAIGDLSMTCADIGKAARVLGYDPKVSIEEGIPDFVNWYEATHGRTTKANG